MRRLLLSFLFLSLLLPLWSADSRPAEEMTTAEIVEELTTLLTEQQEILSGSRAQLEESTTRLEASRQELSLLKESLQQSRTDLGILRMDLDNSMQTLDGLENWLGNSLEEQSRTIDRQKTWLWIITGVAACLAVGVAISLAT